MNFQDCNFPNGMNLIRNYGKNSVLLFCSPKKMVTLHVLVMMGETLAYISFHQVMFIKICYKQIIIYSFITPTRKLVLILLSLLF